MKTFRDQYCQCSEEGLTNGVMRKKITPMMMPFCPKQAKKMLAVIKKDKITHFNFIRCGRFGGQCKSSNIQCRELRMAGEQTEVV